MNSIVFLYLNMNSQVFFHLNMNSIVIYYLNITNIVFLPSDSFSPSEHDLYIFSSSEHKLYSFEPSKHDFYMDFHNLDMNLNHMNMNSIVLSHLNMNLPGWNPASPPDSWWPQWWEIYIAPLPQPPQTWYSPHFQTTCWCRGSPGLGHSLERGDNSL